MMWQATYGRLNLHAGDSNRELIRRLWRKIDRTKRGRDARTMRHDLYRILLEHHADAREVWELFR
jgi:hypothetical protein